MEHGNDADAMSREQAIEIQKDQNLIQISTKTNDLITTVPLDPDTSDKKYNHHAVDRPLMSRGLYILYGILFIIGTCAAVVGCLLITKGLLRNFQSSGNQSSQLVVESINTATPSVTPTHVPTTAPTYVPTIAPTVYVQESVSFYVMGDIPYTDNQWELLKTQLSELDPSSGVFAVHVGDITRVQYNGCQEFAYRQVRDAMQKHSRVPMFVIPGDNDWYDCIDNRKEALEYWMWFFSWFEKRAGWDLSFEVTRDEKRQEQFAFMIHGVQFVGVHVISDGGDGIYDQQEWDERIQDAFDFIIKSVDKNNYMRALVIFGHVGEAYINQKFFKQLVKMIDDISNVAVLYIHGNGHVYKYDPSQSRQNFLRVQVDQGKVAPPIKITVKLEHDEKLIDIFEIDRRGGRYPQYIDSIGNDDA